MTSNMPLETLRTAVIGALPELSASRFTRLTAGWDCVAVDVDDSLIFKFPRHKAAEKALRREASLLAVIRPAVLMPVPNLIIHDGPLAFSRHDKLKGEHLLTEHYNALAPADREHLAGAMALFYAQLHGLDAQHVRMAGAEPIKAWLLPDDILLRTSSVLTQDLHRYADRTIAGWRNLPPDPYGTTFGFFDGHGWNMAFDHTRGRLNGIYDFADSGFGLLHQEFIYSNLISPDLTSRIIREYEHLTGRVIDRARIDLLTGVLRLSELAEHAEDPQHAQTMAQHVADWARREPERLSR